MKPKAKPATHPKKRAVKPIAKAKSATKATKPVAKAAKPAKAAKKPIAKAKPTAKTAKPATKTTKPVAKAAKPVAKTAKPATKATKHIAKATESKVSSPKKEKKSKKIIEAATSNPTAQIESLLMINGAKFVKVPFFFDIEEEAGKRKYVVQQKLPEKPTACSRPKISSNLDSKNLVEFLSQQLEHENKTYFEGCEGQICVKCNSNNVDAKFYVDKSLGYCTECATLLGLGQSKEGVFSDAQMELMRHSMEKSMENVKDIDENDLESALGDMDTLELEETLLSVEEDADFND
jgi:hypothetical protein